MAKGLHKRDRNWLLLHRIELNPIVRVPKVEKYMSFDQTPKHN